MSNTTATATQALSEQHLRPKRLAITIAGAVSLGSYEAGVLWEVLEAVRQHNQDERSNEVKQASSLSESFGVNSTHAR